MQEYDVTLKLLLQGSAARTIHELTGTAVAKWLDVELPKVQNRRLDLLGETVDGGLVHLELQSSQDASMPLRMAEYCLGVFRQLGRLPHQVLLYVGEAELHMENELRGAQVSFRYELIDIRQLDSEVLLESEAVGDNVIAVLARLRDHKEAVHRIVERIAVLPGRERETALAQLLILAGLRHLSATVEEEARKMPIDLDIRDHEVLGPMFRQAHQEGLEEGLEKGLEKGLEEGLEKGLEKGERAVLCRLIEKRFGALPGWASQKLAALSASDLESLSERFLDVNSLEELLK
ncbi:MAG TPA: DUF4351 domain-containing protein [Bryobacteraceae bacterium]|nr:DUF4351 domain-containing protein [Bryobacteraceae bacterium]